MIRPVKNSVASSSSVARESPADDSREQYPQEDPLPDPLPGLPTPINRWTLLLQKLPLAVFWALLAQGLLSITRLITSMTVGGRFGSGSETELGFYSTAFSLLMILVAIFEALVTTPLTVFQQRHPVDDRARFSGHMLQSALLLIGIVTAILALALAAVWSLQLLPKELAIALVAVCAIAPLQLFREFARRWLLSNLDARPAAWLEILFATLFLIGLFSLVIANQVSAVTVFVTLGVVNGIGLAIWWGIYRGNFLLTTDGLRKQLSTNLRYGRWVAGENFTAALALYFCNWYLLFELDEAAAGVFFACFTVVLLANPFLLGVCSILAPRAAAAFNEGSYEGLQSVLLRFGTLILGVLTVFSIGMWLFGEPLTEIFFGPKYREYFDLHLAGRNRITGVLSFAMPLMGLSFVAAIGLLSVHRPHDNFIAALASLISLILLSVYFSSDPTLMTAAISFVASYATAAAVRLMFLLSAFARKSAGA